MRNVVFMILRNLASPGSMHLLVDDSVADRSEEEVVVKPGSFLKNLACEDFCPTSHRRRVETDRAWPRPAASRPLQ